MRAPSFEHDGWQLEDGEQLHRQAPATFEIPNLAVRQILEPGDFAKLVFRIALEGENNEAAVERMWVIVRERTPDGYLGILNNEPSLIEENGDFWLGAELPFEPRHIISVDHANAESLALAKAPPSIPWRN